jgi:pantothenate synthetase
VVQSSQIVEQESLVPLERMDCPSVICVAAWFGKVRLIDNIEIQAPPSREPDEELPLSARLCASG